MSDDVKDIVDDLRESAAQTYEELTQATIDVLNRAADALEAAQQAPAVSQIEEFEFMRGVLDSANANNEIPYSVYCELHDALGRAEVAQAPAVDREALAQVIHDVDYYGLSVGRRVTLRAIEEARAIIASGILLDAAEVEARGARAGYDAGYTNGGYDQADRAAGISPSRIDFDAGLVADARAQQVGEGMAGADIAPLADKALSAVLGVSFPETTEHQEQEEGQQ